MDSRPEGYWETYRDKIASVSTEDIQSGRGGHPNPDEMKVMVIGRWEDIYAGDENGRATMNDIFEGRSTEIPEKDPLTLEPEPDEGLKTSRLGGARSVGLVEMTEAAETPGEVVDPPAGVLDGPQGTEAVGRELRFIEVELGAAAGADQPEPLDEIRTIRLVAGVHCHGIVLSVQTDEPLSASALAACDLRPGEALIPSRPPRPLQMERTERPERLSGRLDDRPWGMTGIDQSVLVETEVLVESSWSSTVGRRPRPRKTDESGDPPKTMPACWSCSVVTVPDQG